MFSFSEILVLQFVYLIVLKFKHVLQTISFGFGHWKTAFFLVEMSEGLRTSYGVRGQADDVTCHKDIAVLSKFYAKFIS